MGLSQIPAPPLSPGPDSSILRSFGCGHAALWGSQSWLPPAFSRRLEFLHFGTDFLTVPHRASTRPRLMPCIRAWLQPCRWRQAIQGFRPRSLPPCHVRETTCLVSGHGFSRAVGGSQFRALAPAAFLLATYVKQHALYQGMASAVPLEAVNSGL